MTKKNHGPSFPFMHGDFERTSRHLRIMTALFDINDPEFEQILVALLERLAIDKALSGVAAPPPDPQAPPPRRLPQAS